MQFNYHFLFLGPLVCLFMLTGAGVIGLFAEHPKPRNRSQPTVTPYQNSHPDELAATHSSNQHGQKGEQERSWIDGLFDKPTDTLLVCFNGLLVSLLPVNFDEPVSEQDYVDVKDGGGKMILFKVLLIYSGALDFTYYSAIAYRIDITTGVNYPVGGDAYNYEKTEKGRATKVMPEIRVIT